MIQVMGCGFFRSISVIAASTRPHGTEKYPARNIKNGIKDSGARRLDQHIFCLGGEADWLNS
jgi:hypothetical protein